MTQNIVIGMVTLSTINQTLFISTLIYLSKGWILTTQGANAFGNLFMSQSEAAKMSTIVAAIYVCYCAYYLTMDDIEA